MINAHECDGNRDAGCASQQDVRQWKSRYPRDTIGVDVQGRGALPYHANRLLRFFDILGIFRMTDRSEKAELNQRSIDTNSVHASAYLGAFNCSMLWDR